MSRMLKTIALGLAGVIPFATAASAKDCKPDPVVQESTPYVSRTLGAFPSSLIAWRKAVVDRHGDGWQAWRRAEDRRIDCEQVDTANGKRWVCTRSARPCSGAIGKEEEKPAFPGKMSRGSKGEGVEVLQKLLVDHGYQIEVDGNFGRGTRDAVRDFQAKEGIKVDGVVGEGTWERLVS